MTDNISDKDKKDWQNFIFGKEKLHSKDSEPKSKKLIKTRSIDLHGYTIEEANNEIADFIFKSYDDDIKKFNELNEDFSKKYVVESEDFDWIENQRPNPFLGRDIKFYIDESPTKEQAELIWDLLVEAGATDGRSIKIYNRVNKLMGHKGKFIIIDYDGNFTYNVSDIGGYIETNKIRNNNFVINLSNFYY